jgi:hypothetical protein
MSLLDRVTETLRRQGAEESAPRLFAGGLREKLNAALALRKMQEK